MKTHITEYLDSKSVPYIIKPHKRPVFTSEDAAEERGVKISQIVKTMLLVGPQGQTIVSILTGDKKLNTQKIKKMTGIKNLKFMDRQTMEEKLGLVVGAIAPVGKALEGLPMYIDPAVFEEEWVDISSGDPQAGLELRSTDLKVLIEKGTVTEITK